MRLSIKIICFCLVAAYSAGSPLFGQEIGWITVSKGLGREHCFSINRNGKISRHGQAETVIKHDDIVEPADEVTLLYSPMDSCCDAFRFTQKMRLMHCVHGPTKWASAYIMINNNVIAGTRMVKTIAKRGSGQSEDKEMYRTETYNRPDSFIGFGYPLKIAFDSDQIERKNIALLADMPAIQIVYFEIDADIVVRRIDADTVETSKQQTPESSERKRMRLS